MMEISQLQDYKSIGYIFFFLLGTCMGSFFQVVGYRVPKKETLMGNSCCNHCGERLRGWQLIPVISFLFLKGKCYYCHAKIGWVHPILECLMGILFCSTAFFLQLSTETIVGLTLVSLLFTISISDALYRIIPNKVLVCFLIIGMIERVFIPQTTYWWYPVAGLLLGFVPLFMIRMIRNDAIGGGDIKLFAVIGLFVGPIGLLMSIVLASCLALIWYVLMYFLKKNKDKYIAFGPFIAIGSYIVYFITSGQLAFMTYLINV